ncbi:hypothetical protein AVEN_176367-1 [Araneus ventricosus]|uniref:Uncharacterized protein n=1 Tax=Araneus ventricosus TaxID=182803 RepID=A0A4Y2C8Y3_ARAVE|nr:hypothetical protein AVEN_176367-1 [Araneus ventricosus]
MLFTRRVAWKTSSCSRFILVDFDRSNYDKLCRPHSVWLGKSEHRRTKVCHPLIHKLFLPEHLPTFYGKVRPSHHAKYGNFHTRPVKAHAVVTKLWARVPILCSGPRSVLGEPRPSSNSSF